MAHFEGYEKRLEVEFVPSSSTFHNQEKCVRGLRALSQYELNEILYAAECTIVSEMCNEYFDSYILSESSLFIDHHHFIIKTCGTTKLLKVIPHLLSHVSRLHLVVRRCRYTRGTYMFPMEQSFPQGRFCDEVEFLDKYFMPILERKALILGDDVARDNLKWHVYYARTPILVGEDDDDDLSLSRPRYTIEMCMTKLHSECAAFFFKDACPTPSIMSAMSGVTNILPRSTICDYSFDPCGYSMNAIEGNAFSTIHVTPEEGFSYASFEAVGYDLECGNFQALIERVLSCFKPSVFSIAIHVNGVSKINISQLAQTNLSRYICDGSSVKKTLFRNEFIVYLTYREGNPCSDSTQSSCVEEAISDNCEEK